MALHPISQSFAMESRFTVQTGECKTANQLIATLIGNGVLESEDDLRSTRLPAIGCIQDVTTISGCVVTPFQFGNKCNPRFRNFYQQLSAHGFCFSAPEYAALLVLQWLRQLRTTGDCDLQVYEHMIVLSQPLPSGRTYHYPGAYDNLYFLRILRVPEGIHLKSTYYHLDHEIGLECPCLVSL